MVRLHVALGHDVALFLLVLRLPVALPTDCCLMAPPSGHIAAAAAEPTLDPVCRVAEGMCFLESRDAQCTCFPGLV